MAVLGGFGLTVTVAPLIEAPLKYVLTAVVTWDVVALVKIATLAPSLAAFVMICWTITIRPNSIIPKTSTKNTGATTANSTTAAPRR